MPMITCPDCRGRTTVGGEDGWGRDVTHGCTFCGARGVIDKDTAEAIIRERIEILKKHPGSGWDGWWKDYARRNMPEGSDL